MGNVLACIGSYTSIKVAPNTQCLGCMIVARRPSMLLSNHSNSSTWCPCCWRCSKHTFLCLLLIYWFFLSYNSLPFVLLSRTFDTLRNHPSFYLFNHRGRVLFRSPEEEPSSVRDQQALPNPIRLRKLEHLHWDCSFHACIVNELR